MDTTPYFEDEDTKHLPDIPIVRRPTVNVVVWDPKTDQILCLDWQKFGWKTFIVGGVELGEDPKDAAIREIQEETGYTNIKFLLELGRLQSGYYAAHKKENRIADTIGFLFQLCTYTQEKISTSLPHTFLWIPRTAVASFITPSSQKYLWERAQSFLS